MKTVIFVQYNPESREEATAVIVFMEQFPEASPPLGDPFWSVNPDMFDCRYVEPKIAKYLLRTLKDLADLYNKDETVPVILNIGAYFELVDPESPYRIQLNQRR